MAHWPMMEIFAYLTSAETKTSKSFFLLLNVTQWANMIKMSVTNTIPVAGPTKLKIMWSSSAIQQKESMP